MNFNLKEDHLVPIYLQKHTDSTQRPVLSFIYYLGLIFWLSVAGDAFLWREIKKIIKNFKKTKSSHEACSHGAHWEYLWKPLLKLMGLWHVLITAIFIINFYPNHTQCTLGYCQHLSTSCYLLKHGVLLIAIMAANAVSSFYLLSAPHRIPVVYHFWMKSKGKKINSEVLYYIGLFCRNWKPTTICIKSPLKIEPWYDFTHVSLGRSLVHDPRGFYILNKVLHIESPHEKIIMSPLHTQALRYNALLMSVKDQVI